MADPIDKLLRLEKKAAAKAAELKKTKEKVAQLQADVATEFEKVALNPATLRIEALEQTVQQERERYDALLQIVHRMAAQFEDVCGKSSTVMDFTANLAGDHKTMTEEMASAVELLQIQWKILQHQESKLAEVASLQDQLKTKTKLISDLAKQLDAARKKAKNPEADPQLMDVVRKRHPAIERLMREVERMDTLDEHHRKTFRAMVLQMATHPYGASATLDALNQQTAALDYLADVMQSNGRWRKGDLCPNCEFMGNMLQNVVMMCTSSASPEGMGLTYTTVMPGAGLPAMPAVQGGGRPQKAVRFNTPEDYNKDMFGRGGVSPQSVDGSTQNPPLLANPQDPAKPATATPQGTPSPATGTILQGQQAPPTVKLFGTTTTPFTTSGLISNTASAATVVNTTPKPDTGPVVTAAGTPATVVKTSEKTGTATEPAKTPEKTGTATEPDKTPEKTGTATEPEKPRVPEPGAKFDDEKEIRDITYDPGTSKKTALVILHISLSQATSREARKYAFENFRIWLRGEETDTVPLGELENFNVILVYPDNMDRLIASAQARETYQAQTMWKADRIWCSQSTRASLENPTRKLTVTRYYQLPQAFSLQYSMFIDNALQNNVGNVFRIYLCTSQSLTEHVEEKQIWRQYLDLIGQFYEAKQSKIIVDQCGGLGSFNPAQPGQTRNAIVIFPFSKNVVIDGDTIIFANIIRQLVLSIPAFSAYIKDMKKHSNFENTVWKINFIVCVPTDGSAYKRYLLDLLVHAEIRDGKIFVSAPMTLKNGISGWFTTIPFAEHLKLILNDEKVPQVGAADMSTYLVNAHAGVILESLQLILNTRNSSYKDSDEDKTKWDIYSADLIINNFLSSRIVRVGFVKKAIFLVPIYFGSYYDGDSSSDCYKENFHNSVERYLFPMFYTTAMRDITTWLQGGTELTDAQKQTIQLYDWEISLGYLSFYFVANMFNVISRTTMRVWNRYYDQVSNELKAHGNDKAFKTMDLFKDKKLADEFDSYIFVTSMWIPTEKKTFADYVKTQKITVQKPRFLSFLRPTEKQVTISTIGEVSELKTCKWYLRNTEFQKIYKELLGYSKDVVEETNKSKTKLKYLGYIGHGVDGFNDLPKTTYAVSIFERDYQYSAAAFDKEKYRDNFKQYLDVSSNSSDVPFIIHFDEADNDIDVVEKALFRRKIRSLAPTEEDAKFVDTNTLEKVFQSKWFKEVIHGSNSALLLNLSTATFDTKYYSTVSKSKPEQLQSADFEPSVQFYNPSESLYGSILNKAPIYLQTDFAPANLEPNSLHYYIPCEIQLQPVDISIMQTILDNLSNPGSPESTLDVVLLFKLNDDHTLVFYEWNNGRMCLPTELSTTEFNSWANTIYSGNIPFGRLNTSISTDKIDVNFADGEPVVRPDLKSLDKLIQSCFFCKTEVQQKIPEKADQDVIDAKNYFLESMDILMTQKNLWAFAISFSDQMKKKPNPEFELLETTWAALNNELSATIDQRKDFDHYDLMLKLGKIDLKNENWKVAYTYIKTPSSIETKPSGSLNTLVQKYNLKLSDVAIKFPEKPEPLILAWHSPFLIQKNTSLLSDVGPGMSWFEVDIKNLYSRFKLTNEIPPSLKISPIVTTQITELQEVFPEISADTYEKGLNPEKNESQCDHVDLHNKDIAIHPHLQNFFATDILGNLYYRKLIEYYRARGCTIRNYDSIDQSNVITLGKFSKCAPIARKHVFYVDISSLPSKDILQQKDITDFVEKYLEIQSSDDKSKKNRLDELITVSEKAIRNLTNIMNNFIDDIEKYITHYMPSFDKFCEFVVVFCWLDNKQSFEYIWVISSDFTKKLSKSMSPDMLESTFTTLHEFVHNQITIIDCLYAVNFEPDSTTKVPRLRLSEKFLDTFYTRVVLFDVKKGGPPTILESSRTVRSSKESLLSFMNESEKELLQIFKNAESIHCSKLQKYVPIMDLFWAKIPKSTGDSDLNKIHERYSTIFTTVNTAWLSCMPKEDAYLPQVISDVTLETIKETYNRFKEYLRTKLFNGVMSNSTEEFVCSLVYFLYDVSTTLTIQKNTSEASIWKTPSSASVSPASSTSLGLFSTPSSFSIAKSTTAPALSSSSEPASVLPKHMFNTQTLFTQLENFMVNEHYRYNGSLEFFDVMNSGKISEFFLTEFITKLNQLCELVNQELVAYGDAVILYILSLSIVPNIKISYNDFVRIKGFALSISQLQRTDVFRAVMFYHDSLMYHYKGKSGSDLAYSELSSDFWQPLLKLLRKEIKTYKEIVDELKSVPDSEPNKLFILEDTFNPSITSFFKFGYESGD